MARKKVQPEEHPEETVVQEPAVDETINEA